jgi:hypothetical protein
VGWNVAVVGRRLRRSEDQGAPRRDLPDHRRRRQTAPAAPRLIRKGTDVDSIYFLTMLIGIAWICAWAAVDKPNPGFGWWPFDMLEDKPDAERIAEAEAAAAKTARRGGVARTASASRSGVTSATRSLQGVGAGAARGQQGASAGATRGPQGASAGATRGLKGASATASLGQQGNGRGGQWAAGATVASIPVRSGRDMPVTSWRDRVAGRAGRMTGGGADPRGGERGRPRPGPGAGAPPGRRRP